MKNKPFFGYAIILLCVSSFISCRNKQPNVSAAISNNIDTEMVLLADMNIERLKISQQYLGSYFEKRYSDLIKEYEKNKDYVSKVNLLNRVIEEKFTSADKPHPSELKTTGYPGIIRYNTDGNFDLAIKSNDAFVAQVKFINTKFQTLDKTALDAISFYEQLTPDQKKLYFDVSNGAKAPAKIPAPDYQGYLARELQRGYYHYQYHLQALFYYYYKQKTANLLRGFEGQAPNARVLPRDKQFDLPILASKQ